MRTLKVLKYFLSIIVFSFIISSCTPGFNNNKRKSSGDGCEEAFFCIEGFFSNASLFDFLIPKVYAQAVEGDVRAAVKAPIGASFFDACPNADQVSVSDCLSLFDKCAVLYVNDEVNCVTKVDSSNNKYQFIYKVNPNFSAEKSIFKIEIVANNSVGAGKEAAGARTRALRAAVFQLPQLEGKVQQDATLRTTTEAPWIALAFKNSAFNNLLFDWDQLKQKIAGYFSSLGVTGSNNYEIIKNAFNSGHATTFLDGPSLFAQEVLAPTIALDSDKALALCNVAKALNDVQKLAEQIAVLVPLNNNDINFCLPSVLEKFASYGSTTGDLGIAYQALQNGDLNACSAISMVSSLNLSAVVGTGFDVTSMVTTLTSSPLYTDNCESRSADAGGR